MTLVTEMPGPLCTRIPFLPPDASRPQSSYHHPAMDEEKQSTLLTDSCYFACGYMWFSTNLGEAQ